MFLRNVGEFMSDYSRHTPERVRSFGVMVFFLRYSMNLPKYFGLITLKCNRFLQ